MSDDDRSILWWVADEDLDRAVEEAAAEADAASPVASVPERWLTSPGADDVVSEVVELGDIDELVRHVGRLASAGEWASLARLRRLCLLAVERGRQLWPAAAYAEHRLALEAPAPAAAAVVAEPSGRVGPGPLTEVVAQGHGWEQLVHHLEPGPVAAAVALERVVRGEDLAHAPGSAWVSRYADGVALARRAWEPAPPLPRYTGGGVQIEAPPRPAGQWTAVPLPGGRSVERVDDPHGVAALVDVGAGWVEGSGGTSRAAAAAGGAPEAIALVLAGEGGLGHTEAPTSVLAHPLEPAVALAWVEWAAGSGGRRGRRRGAAAGRFASWWLLAALGDELDGWPLAPDEHDVLGEVASELRWWLWDAPGAPPCGTSAAGWGLHLAVEDADEGIAWALSANG